MVGAGGAISRNDSEDTVPGPSSFLRPFYSERLLNVAVPAVVFLDLRLVVVILAPGGFNYD